MLRLLCWCCEACAVMSVRLDGLHDLSELLDAALNTVAFLVELAQKAISELDHDALEGEEEVGLEALFGEDGTTVAIISLLIQEAEVQHCEHLVHALHVLDARVKLGVNE